MIKILFKTVGFLFLLFVLNCYLPPNINAPNQTQTATWQPSTGQQPVIGQPFTGGGQVVQPQTVGFDQPGRNDDRDLPEPDRRRDSSCESERSSHSCHRLCRTMYSRDRDECLEEEPDTIEDLYEVYQDLEGARNLDSIDLELFEDFLDVSITSLTSIIRDYNRNDAEDMLIWIAEDNEVAELIRAEDDDFRILNDLLSLMIRFDNTRLEVPFKRRIDGRDTLMDYALSSGNAEALDYFLEYIFAGDRDCRNDRIHVDCLTVICEIGRGSVVERDRDYYFDSSVFEEFILEIIDDSINGVSGASTNDAEWVKGSGDGKIDDISDLDYTWAGTVWAPDDGELSVCGGLEI